MRMRRPPTRANSTAAPPPPKVVTDGRRLRLQAGGKTGTSNLGKFTERLVASQNDEYRHRRIGKIEHIPNAWRHVSPHFAQRLAPNIRAVTGDHRHIVRAQSPWDFHGHYKTMPLAFDAKEFAQSNIPVKELKPHQAEHLAEFEQTGGCAGFLILSKRENRLYWLDAAPALELVDRLRHNIRGHLKSLNLAWLAAHAFVIGDLTPAGSVDFAEPLYNRWRAKHDRRSAGAQTP